MEIRDGILEGDCIEVMRGLPDACVDMVFADPPYNLQLGGSLTRPDESVVDAVDDDWDKFRDFAEYDDFSRRWLTEARRILKPDGCLWVIGSYHNVFRLGAALQDLGFWILNDIVWVKSNPMPNFRGTRFTNAHETLIWASRSKGSRYRFNYEALKAGNDDVQVRSDWTIPLCTGSERLKGDDGTKVHPTQKPEALLARILMANTSVGDLVLDPFSGTGTTCAVAKALGRRHVGIERDPSYLAASRERLSQTERLPDDAFRSHVSKRDAVRVPFRSVVENGLVPAGATLVDAKRRFRAVVRVDGGLDIDGEVVSIHRGAANLLGRQSCNGWDFWFAEKGEVLVPIESFRQTIRSLSAPT